MPRAFDKWTVLPHRAIEKISNNIWRVEGDLAGIALKRVMVVVKLGDGRLLLHNPIALGPDAMGELEAWGAPAYLVVPNGYHRLDARIFKQRYPDARVIGPSGHRKRIEQVIKLDGTYEEFSDPSVRFEYLEGLAHVEAAMLVRSSDGETMVVTDGIFNLQEKLPGAIGAFFHFIGSKPGPRVTWLARTFMVKDRAAYRTQLERFAERPELRRVIVAHGTMVADNCQDFLRAAAATLG